MFTRMKKIFLMHFGKFQTNIKKKYILVPVKKILRSINSCQNEEDIEKCKILINNYVKSAKKNDLVNYDELFERLNTELLERQEALYLSKIFNDNEEEA